MTVRKLRLQAQEHTRERDLAKAEALHLEKELAAAKNEVASVRNSVISEKKTLEQRLSEERRAKERTRVQLEERLEAAQQKQSKFRVSRIDHSSHAFLWADKNDGVHSVSDLHDVFHIRCHINQSCTISWASWRMADPHLAA